MGAAAAASPRAPRTPHLKTEVSHRDEGWNLCAAAQGGRTPRYPVRLSPEAIEAVSSALNAILADAFALYLKTKNFHWHVSGPHFRGYHLLLDEQAEQIFATTPTRPATKAGERWGQQAEHGRQTIG
jgi:hypothetical protein